MKNKFLITTLLLILGCLSVVAASSDNLNDTTIYNPDSIKIYSSVESAEIQIYQPDSTVLLQRIRLEKKIRTRTPYSDFLLNLDEVVLKGVFARTLSRVSKIVTPKKWKNEIKRGRSNAYYKYGTHFTTQGVGIGFNFCGNIAQIGLRPGHSFDINWLCALGIQHDYNLSSFCAGVGANWRQFKLAGTNIFDSEDGNLQIIPTQGTVPLDYSCLNTISIQFPLMWKQRLKVWMWNTPLTLSAGPIITLTPWANVRTKFNNYNNLDNSIIKHTKIINQQRFGVDIIGSVGFTSYGSIYLRYAPMGVMKSESTLNFHPISVGFLFGW